MSTASKAMRLPASFTAVRTFQGIDEYVLSNGLKVLLFPDPSQANVTVNLTYLVGSRHEGRGEAGMAHLLEHMLFRGTTSKRDIKGLLQDKGAQFNATTWFDRTNYFETLTPTKENLAFALELEADRMINSLILQEDLSAEMTVVRNEFEMGENNPVHVLHDQVMSAAYRWHNYAKSTIGNRSDIERVPAETLRQFYQHYYQPDNAVLVVAGQFDEQSAIDLINQYFASIRKPSRALEQTYTEEPAQDGPREVVLERVGDIGSVAAAYHIPAASHDDHAALRVFMDAICDEPGGLLYQQLVETGIASELFSVVYSLCEPGMAMCFLRPIDEGQAFAIRDQFLDLIENKAADALEAKHVERIKARQLKRFRQSMTNSKEVALKLSEAIACGDWRLFFWHKEQIEKVTLEDVQRVAKRYFLRSNRTSGVFVPQTHVERVEIERVLGIDAILAELKADESLSEGEVFVASPQNIEAKVKRAKLNAWQQLAFLPKKTRGEAARSHLVIRYGYEEALVPFEEELALLPAVLWRGTTKYPFQDLRDKLDSLMTTMDLNGHAGLIVSNLKSERRHIGDALELLAHILQNPRFDAREFAVVKQREIDDYEEIKSDPQRVAFHELDRLKHPWPKNDYFYVPTFDERIATLKAMSLDRVQEAYTTLFSTQNLSLGLIGDADPAILDQASSWFNCTKNLSYERVKKRFIENDAQEVICSTKDKEMAMIAYAYNFPMRDDNDDYPVLKLANYMFGENMNSRLMNRIREREGISYGAGSWLEVGRHEEIASLNIYAMAAPQSISRAKNAVKEEWEKFLSEGVTETELRNAQESMWLSFENNLANDGYLVNALTNDLDIGRTFLWREQFFNRIKQITPEEITAALSNWWSTAKFSIVVAGDEQKMK